MPVLILSMILMAFGIYQASHWVSPLERKLRRRDGRR